MSCFLTLQSALKKSNGVYHMTLLHFDRTTHMDVGTVKATAAKNGTRVWYHELDVTDADAFSPVFDNIRKQIRHPLRGLVACTGISAVCDATSYPIDAFRKILDVNIAGTFLTAQAVGKEIQKTDVTGSVILIASMSGWNSNKVPCTSTTCEPADMHRESTAQPTMLPNPLCTN